MAAKADTGSIHAAVRCRAVSVAARRCRQFRSSSASFDIMGTNAEQTRPIEVRHYGIAGPELVLLHGGPGAPGSVADLAFALSGQFTVHEPLQRRAGPHPLGVERHVRDLLDVAPPRAVVVGWSWGAMLGLSFAARHPERVSRLALIGCGTYDEACREILVRRRTKLLGDAGCARQKELEQRMRSAPDATARDAALADLGKLFSDLEGYDLINEGDPSLGGGLPANVLAVDSLGGAQTWQDVLRLQQERVEPQIFANIRVPVLMLHGDHDPHPGPCTRDRLHQYMPQLEYVEFSRCGHQPWRERHARARFLEVICKWAAS
jgi:pimeloyl-ACP methyl ester carboxylesterase